MACSSDWVMAHPQVNSTVRRRDDSDSRCLMSSWLAPAPSTRTSSFDRIREGPPERRGQHREVVGEGFDPAFPGRSSMARHSRVLEHHAASGWKP